ncbi:MAG: hypothetical protein RLN62_02830 [Rickettsiales bacterium]
MNKKISFLSILEGVVKFNIILFCFGVVFSLVKFPSVERFLFLFEEQFFLIISSILLGKIYQSAFGYKFSAASIKMQSIFFGYVVYSLFRLLSGVFSSQESLLSISTLISFIVGFIYWYCIIFLSKNTFMKRIIDFLHGTVEYKSFFQLFWMFNVAFFVLIIVMISVGMLAGRSLFSSIFVILYFEVAFIVFNIFSAKFFDYLWSNNTFDQKKVSVMGLYFASIVYVLKINIIDENIFGILQANNDKAILAVAALISFWTFFVLLFRVGTGVGTK